MCDHRKEEKVKVLKWLDKHFEETLMSIFLLIIIVMMTMQVVMRYIFRNALPFPEEVSRYCFIWMSYLGVSYAVKTGGSLKVDILQTLIPALTKPLETLGDIMYAAFSAVMILPGIGVVKRVMEIGSKSAAIQLPMWIIYLSFLVGAVLTVIRTIQKIIAIICSKKEAAS